MLNVDTSLYSEYSNGVMNKTKLTPAETRMIADMKRTHAHGMTPQCKLGIYTVQLHRNGYRVARNLIAKGLVVECTEEHPSKLLSIKFPA